MEKETQRLRRFFNLPKSLLFLQKPSVHILCEHKKFFDRERGRKMENMVLHLALYKHNGVVLSPRCVLYLFSHLSHDCGYKWLLSLQTGMDERGLSEEDRCGEGYAYISASFWHKN